MSPQFFHNPTQRHLVLASANVPRAFGHQRSLRERGWETHLATSGGVARHLAMEWNPELIIVEDGLEGESGWLTCAKLSLVESSPEVLFLCDRVTSDVRKWAEFIGVHAESLQEDLVSLVSSWPRRLAYVS